MAENFEEKRQRGKQKGIDEAFKEGERIYNDGFSSVTSGINKQITKGFMYEKSAIEALEKGYKAAKNKDKEKKNKNPDRLNKKAGGRIKMNKGGMLKTPPNKGAASLPEGVRNSMGFMKKGGKVKGYAPGGKVKKMNKCRMDGIAIRGKTRAKQRSK